MKNILDIKNIIPYEKIIMPKDANILGVTTDSRRVRSGYMFVCLQGSRVDGHNYAQNAASLGATAVITERELDLPDNVTQFIVNDSRKAMQLAIPYFYDYPCENMRVIAITGTNGKTTIAHMIAHLLEDAGCKVGIIGTVHVVIDGKEEPIRNTTPDVDELQDILFRMKKAGITHVVMEVSSHALALQRVSGCEFDTAIFTNLTQDHLDFHGDMEAYGAAKAELFHMVSEQGCKSPKYAIINADDPYCFLMRDALDTNQVKPIEYGVREKADFYAKNIIVNALGTNFTLVHEGAEYPLYIQPMGLFNVYNTLASIIAVWAEGFGLPSILTAMSEFTSVPGRFERIDEGQEFAVIVDYAHTPDGLENILKTACEMTDGRVLIAFGCGGDRDKTKRPIMGEIAAKYADVVYITSDNPRSEAPDDIIKEIAEGARRNQTKGKNIFCESRRDAAIKKVIAAANPGDVVLIAGKGHEDYQILKKETIHFDDREEARKALQER